MTVSKSTTPKDYLILSLKWSQASDELVWYAPDRRGYTTNIDKAGRYNREEVRENTIRGVTVGVLAKEAARLSEEVVYVPRRNLKELLEPTLRPCEVCGSSGGKHRQDGDDFICDKCFEES